MNDYDLQGSQILIIDDIPDNLQLIAHVLDDCNYNLFMKSNGPEAIGMLDTMLPDLILLDIRMPEMNGFEVCQKLKDNDATREIPIIFISAVDDISDIQRGFEVGGVDYITKPFNNEEVKARVKNHLSLTKLREKLKIKNQELEEVLQRERNMVEHLRLNLSLSLPHELRTPLNGILGFSEILSNMTEAPSLEEIIEYAGMIHSSGKRLQRLVENSLIYANLKLVNYTSPNGKIIEAKKEIFQAKEFLEQLCSEEAINYGRLEDLILDLQNLSLNTSRDNLRKIIVEILSNAFKFSRAGSNVRVSTGMNENNHFIEFSDNGSGMNPDQLESIGGFMQFQRDKQAQQGMGFGLAISILLAKMENVNLKISSIKDSGTTIRLSFPF